MEKKKCDVCEKCPHNKDGECCNTHHGCCGMRGCHHFMKVVVIFIVLAIVFCIGVNVGKNPNWSNWKYRRQIPAGFDKTIGQENAQTGTGSVTVNVTPKEDGADTNTPPVLE